MRRWKMAEVKTWASIHYGEGRGGRYITESSGEDHPDFAWLVLQEALDEEILAEFEEEHGRGMTLKEFKEGAGLAEEVRIDEEAQTAAILYEDIWILIAPTRERAAIMLLDLFKEFSD
jgi:hypothetical protein